MRGLIFICLFLVAACGDRTVVPFAPEAAEVGTVEPILVATQRSRDEHGWFNGERAEQLSFLNVDVSVPPDRDKGQLPRSYGPVPKPDRHFAVTGRDDYKDDRAFTQALKRQLRALPAQDRDVLIYVHGYNNTFTDGIFRIAQMQHDLQLSGVAMHYSWPSAANPLGYTYDRDSVLFTRDGLEQMLRAVSAAQPRRIVLVGHSLGTMLVMETLRQMEIRSPGWSKRHLGGVVLIAPDLDIDVFRAQAQRIAQLPSPFIVFTSSQDRALHLSRRINGSHVRLGGLQDAGAISNLPVTLVDVSEFASSRSANHFTPGTSPLLINMLRRGEEVQQAFESDMAGRSGLVPGTVITAQQATQVILSPLMLARQAAR